MIYGIDYIGGVNYIDVVKKYHPHDFAIGILNKASGWDNGIKAARYWCKHDVSRIYRISGIWHDNHTFNKQDIEPAVLQAEKVARLATKYPNYQFYFQPWLEPGTHQKPCSYKLLKRVKKACREVLPKRVKIVTGRQMPKGWSEVHHGAALSGKYIASFDGLSMFDTDSRHWLTEWYDARIVFGWCWQCNGKWGEGDRRAREDRTDWLTAILLRRMEGLMG